MNLSYSALISDFLLTINNENVVCSQTFTISSHPSWKHLFDALTERSIKGKYGISNRYFIYIVSRIIVILGFASINYFLFKCYKQKTYSDSWETARVIFNNKNCMYQLLHHCRLQKCAYWSCYKRNFLDRDRVPYKRGFVQSFA
jgi:hypothetical protein